MSGAKVSPYAVKKGVDRIKGKNKGTTTQEGNTTPTEQQTTESDSLEKAAREVVESRNKKSGKVNAEMLDRLTADNQPIYVDEVKEVTGFGDRGARVITGLANRDGITFSQAKSAVENAYQAGFSNVKAAQVNFDNKLQQEAFRAGKYDRAMDDAAKLAESKNARVFEGAFTENEYTKNYTKGEKKMIATVVKALKMDISAVDEILASITYDKNGNEVKHYANAEHNDGKMRIAANKDVGKAIYALVLHESGHRMSQLAPNEFNALMDALYQRAEQSGRKANLGVNVSVFNSIKAEHDNAGIEMNTRDYIEEIAVRELETIFSSAEEFNKWYAEISGNQELKGNWQKFCEWISQVIEDIKKVFMSEGKKTELAELENIKGLLANAIKGAESAAQERASKVQAKQGAEAKSSTNLENQIKEEYNEVANHSLKRKRTVYNEYQTNAMIWARDSSRQPGDLKILNRNGKDFVVIEATNDGFVELTSGKYEEVVAIYERIHREKDTSFYEDAQEIRAEQNRSLWDLQYVENRGDATGNGEQIRSEELQSNTTGNDKHMRNGDKGESEQSAITNYSLKNSADADVDGVLDVRDIISYVPIRKVKMKVFPPYDESESDANEWSTRWAHREEVETGAQKIAFYHNGCYVIEKYDSTELKYLIVGKINYNYYKEVREELKDARNRQKQSQEKMANIVSGRNGRGNSDGGRRPSPDYSSVEHGREDREVWRLDRKQDGKRQIQSDTDRSDEYDSKDRQTRGLTNDIQSSSSVVEKSSSNNSKNETEEDYNKNKSYSLKQWHTGLSRAQIEAVEKWVHDAGDAEATRITDTANWYMGRLNGRDLFAIYSTEVADSPTVLYVSKDQKAKVELDILMDYMEEKEYGKSINGKSTYVSWVSGSGWLQRLNSSKNTLGNLGGGQNNQNAGVLPGQSQRNGSRAFWSVIENIFRRQEKEEINENKSHSLKGGIQTPSKWTKEFLDTIEDVRDGKKNATNRLYKYVEDGTLSTKDYDDLIEKYGAIPSGENPHREVQVPRKTADGKKVSQTVRTILEAKATPDEAVPTIEKMVEDGIFSYDAYTDKQAIKDAEDYLKEYGWNESLRDWLNDVEKGIVSKQHTAMGWALYNNAANTAMTSTSERERREAINDSLNILNAMAKHQRSAAQALQATRILKKLSPETQLYGVQKSVQALQKELIDRYGNRAPDLKIDEVLAAEFLNAGTEDERLAAEIEIYKDIGRQVPSNWLDKWNAVRYIAMLANIRTHGRNILGNAFFAPVVIAKNLTATAIEAAVYRISGKKTVRGKALVWGSKADRELLKAAWSDYDNVADLISNGGKYNDFAMAEFLNRMTCWQNI